MIGDTAPLVTFAHDWTSPVERVRRIPSTVLARRSGSTQRLARSNRATDHLTYRLIAPSTSDATAWGPLATLATDALVRMPRWEDQARLEVTAAAASVLIACDTTDRPTFAPESQVLFWRGPGEYEVGRLDTVAPTEIRVYDNLVSAWAPGTIVVPITAGRAVLPFELTRWTPTTGALTFAIETTLVDLAGVGTGGTATTGVPFSMSVGGRTLKRTERAPLVATVLDAAGNALSGDGIVWSTADATIAPVYATMDPRVAIVTNARPDSSLGALTSRTITATLGALVATASVGLSW